MITGFDHAVIAVSDIAAGVRAYEELLGARAHLGEPRDGVATAIIATPNLSVELMAPVGEGAERLRAALADGGEGLKSLVFAVTDIDAAHRRCERVGLKPEEIKPGPPASSRQMGDQLEAGGAKWRSFRASTERTHGVRLFFLQRAEALTAESGNVSGIDHIVIRTPDIEPAAALYGARLRLDMRLDREVMGRRLMFFRCGDAIVEIILDPALNRDTLWGLSWRVQDADAAHARLAASGFDVSEVRAGMKPGTRVFTVRDGTCGVPTLMIEGSRRD